MASLPQEDFRVVQAKLEDLPNVRDADLAPIAKLFGALALPVLRKLPLITERAWHKSPLRCVASIIWRKSYVRKRSGVGAVLCERARMTHLLLVGLPRLTDALLTQSATVRIGSFSICRPRSDDAGRPTWSHATIERAVHHCHAITDAGMKHLLAVSQRRIPDSPEPVGVDGFRELTRLAAMNRMQIFDQKGSPEIGRTGRAVVRIWRASPH